MNILKNPLVSFILGMLLILGLGVFASGSAIGGTTNYDDLAVDSITVSGVATLGSVSTGAISGTTGTFTGVIAGSAEGNKLGSKNSYNPIYVGAGDGCTAILYAASTTLVSSATSTSFCNN